MVSILILTYNEAKDLPGCIQSVEWSDDVHIVDSISSDNTQAIARAAGAKVHPRSFTTYSDQRNTALLEIKFSYEWVLILDADERVPALLASEIKRFVAGSPSKHIVAARMRRRDYLSGKWLKHAQLSPFYIRLVRPKEVHYEREINEVLIPHGEVVDLREPFDHYPFSKGFTHWIDKHNRYSSMEAKRSLEERVSKVPFSWKLAMTSGDFNIRRYHQKGLFFRLPCRPLIKFIYILCVRRGICDGRAGMTYAILQSIYEYFIIIKEREIESKAQGAPDP